MKKDKDKLSPKMKLLFFIFLLFIGTFRIFATGTDPKINKVCFNDNCFSVELALTPQEQIQGLMFREFLPQNSGMLFIFDKEEIWPFYMKNTLIPLDIIWVNKKKMVVFIEENARPCREEPCPLIYPDKSAAYVIELNAGMSDEIGLEAGCIVEFIGDKESRE